MAVDTHITALTEASCITVANGVKVWQRTVDAAVHALADGAHFELFSMPAGTLVITGIFEVLSAETTTTTATLALGIGGTGTEYLSATATNVTAKIVITNSGVMLNSGAADTIDMSAGTAATTNSKVRVTLLTLDVDGATSRGATGTA